MKLSTAGAVGLLVAEVIACGACSGTIYGNADNQYDDAAYCTHRTKTGDPPKSCADWCRAQAAAGPVPNGCGVYAACSNGAKRCSGNSVQICDNLAWRDQETCQGADYCDADTTQCKTPCVNMTCGTDHGVTCGGPCSNGQGCDKTHHCSDPSPGMVWVPSGSLVPGASYQSSGQAVNVDSFQLDLMEVTVGDYGKCVSAGKCSSDSLNMNGKSEQLKAESKCNWGNAAKQDHPMNCVTWQNAADYCSWAGKRLPSEWEWEYAGRYDDRRDYPWGNESPNKTSEPSNPKLSCCGQANGTCHAGSHPDGESKLGLNDMVGSVREWTDSWYCMIPPCEHVSIRATCGGCSPTYLNESHALHDRSSLYPDEREWATGFRCAK